MKNTYQFPDAGFGEQGVMGIRPGGAPLGFYPQLELAGMLTGRGDNSALANAADPTAAYGPLQGTFMADLAVMGSTMLNQYNIPLMLANSYKQVEIAAQVNGKSRGYMWEAQAISMMKAPLQIVGAGLMAAVPALLASGVGAPLAGLAYIAGFAITAVANSIQVNPTTGERLTRFDDRAATNTGLAAVTSILPGAAGAIVSTASNAAAQGIQYNDRGNISGYSLAGAAGEAALVTGLVGAAAGVAGYYGSTKPGVNAAGETVRVSRFDTNTFNGKLANGALNQAISTPFNTLGEYYKLKNLGAEYSNYSSLANPDLGTLGSLAGVGLSAAITTRLEGYAANDAERRAREAQEQGRSAQAAQILAAAGFSRARRDEILNGYESNLELAEAHQYYERITAEHNRLYKDGHTDEADALRAELAQNGFGTEGVDNYRAYIKKDFERNQRQQGYFTTAAKMGANGFDESRGLFYVQETGGGKTFIVPAGDSVRMVAENRLPTTGGPNASHMSGSSATYSQGQLVSVQDPQKYQQWRFAQQVGSRLGLSAGESNYANVMRMFGSEANATAFLRGEEYVDVGLPGGPNAAYVNPTYNPWTRGVIASMSWADNARDRAGRAGYGAWQSIKDSSATMLGGTMEVLDAWVVTPARGAADLALRILYPGMEPGIAKAESEYHVGSRWHQKRLELMGEIGGGLSAAGGIRMAAGLTGKLGSAARPAAYFENIAYQATRNPGSDTLVLGHFASKGESYQKVAAHYKATYFKVDDWKGVTNGMTREETWNINKAFLNQQLPQNKKILFSHDPLKPRPGTFFEREVKFLQREGYSFRRVHQWAWEAVR